jgi:hypothetical protein
MKALALFGAGTVFGAALMFAFGSRDESNRVASIAQVPIAAEELSPSSPVETSSQSIAHEDPLSAAPNASGPMTSRVYESRLPQQYQEMIDSVRPRRLTFRERHIRFAQELRDEPWAFAMEAGITDFYAARAPSLGAVIESIECRAENCEVAGYLADGTEHISSNLYEFTSEPWWQGSDATSVHEFEADGRDSFVLLTFQHDGHLER